MYFSRVPTRAKVMKYSNKGAKTKAVLSDACQPEVGTFPF